jgi:UDP-N-acetylmuramoyl-tripeptide--D-alanyl-D-alanine ligase
MSDLLMNLLLIERIAIGLLVALFVLALVLKTLYWAYLWQLKEYRTDRMRDFLLSPSGRRTIWSPRNLAEFLLLMWFVVAEVVLSPTPIVIELTAVLFAGVLFMNAVLYGRQRLVPVWTAKAVALVALMITLQVGVLGLLFLTTVSELLAMAAVLVITPLSVSLAVLAFQPLTAVQKQRVIRRAKAKITELQPTVIGVTGSYGKSSTKEFLAAILGERFSTLATPKNINVDIGVAQTILDSLRPEHEVFVVEMGAYRPGEIDAICDLVSPIIGVLTAINEQHLALFGSLQAIIDTKSELLEALPAAGLAVVNRDIPACMEAAERTTARRKFFSVQDVAHTYATDIQVEPTRVRFLLHIGAERLPAVAHLAGAQVVPSLLAAATVAAHMGMTIQEIVAAIAKVQPVFGTMQLRNGRTHAFVIDDSYNSNPDGFLAALDYLAQFHDKRKIVVTPGMVELGVESDMHHRTVGSRIGEVADLLVITKQDSAKPLRDAAKQGGLQESQIIVSERLSGLREVLDGVTHEDVILIEGRVQGQILGLLLGDEEP